MNQDTMTTPAFTCGESVTISATGRPATVDAVMIEGVNVTYRIAWWAESDRKQCWVAGHEIEKS